MKCPKCGFDGSGDSCLKCGVVFSKLNLPPRPRPARVPPPDLQRSGLSLLNVLVLGCVFLLAGMTGWYLWNRMEKTQTEPDLSTQSPSQPLPERFRFDATRHNQRTSSGSDGTLKLKGLTPDGSQPSASEESVAAARRAPNLPSFNERNITPALVVEIVELARRFPDDPIVRHAAGLAHLALVVRRFSDGRYREALDIAESSEEWDPPPRELAWVKARAHLELRQLGDAQLWAQAALAFGPDRDMYNVLGQVYYLREEMAKAVEAWQHALELGEDPKIRASLEKALREMKVADSYNRQRLSHFIVRYEGDTMEDTGRMVLGSLERSYAYLKSSLGFEPSEPIVIILYARREYAELGGPHWSAGLFDGKVRVPVRGLASLDRHVESTLRHELTHAFLFARAGKNCPRWLQEGVAEYSEGSRADEFGEMLAEKIRSDGNFAYCLVGERCNVRYFYPAATSLVQYMLQNRGMGGIRDLLAHLGDGRDIDYAVREVYGRDEMGLVNDWQHFIKRRY